MLGGNNSNIDLLVRTNKEIEDRYRCDLGSCKNCKREICKQSPRKKYNSFLRRRNKALRKVEIFNCKEQNKRCGKKCPEYKKCNKDTKKNFEKWRRACLDNNKELLKKFFGI